MDASCHRNKKKFRRVKCAGVYCMSLARVSPPDQVMQFGNVKFPSSFYTLQGKTSTFSVR